MRPPTMSASSITMHTHQQQQRMGISKLIHAHTERGDRSGCPLLPFSPRNMPRTRSHFSECTRSGLSTSRPRMFTDTDTYARTYAHMYAHTRTRTHIKGTFFENDGRMCMCSMYVCFLHVHMRMRASRHLPTCTRMYTKVSEARMWSRTRRAPPEAPSLLSPHA